MTKTEYANSSWIQFLRQYGPIPNNDNMYDEQIQRSARRHKVQPLQFDTGKMLDDLCANFRKADPNSVILTGTAGDGKTYLCRKLWLELGGSQDDWEGEKKILELTLPCQRTLRVIRDLTEIGDAESDQFFPMAMAIFGDTTVPVFLIAANDGQMLQAWDRIKGAPRGTEAKQAIEKLLLQQQFRTQLEGGNLTLFNLSRQSSAELMKKVFVALLGHEGWKRCDGCAGQSDDPALRCPIWENYEHAQRPLFQERVVNLLELGDHSGFHLPVRHLLVLGSNMLLGHPEVKDGLMRCKDIPKIVKDESTHKGSLYNNLLGENLTPIRREQTQGFDVLSRFGIGDETSNRIDALLVYGAHDTQLADQFDQLLRADKFFGAHEQFLRLQAQYLELGTGDHQQLFCDMLRAQRQRLFFTLPSDQRTDLPLWELTVFRHGGDFLEKILAPLRKEERVNRRVIALLVRGLNRVFTGMMTGEDKMLYLASSGSYSQARTSRVLERKVNVDGGLNERVVIEMDEGRPTLFVFLDKHRKVPLPLHLVRFEFLCRVAEGALPTNFSRECYEDVLSFKSRLLRSSKEQTGQERNPVDREFTLTLLATETTGQLREQTLSVQLEDRR